jgi:hypothetical protein
MDQFNLLANSGFTATCVNLGKVVPQRLPDSTLTSIK